MSDVILVINVGSSSIKYKIYRADETLALLYYGAATCFSEPPCLSIFNADHQQILKKMLSSQGTVAGLQAFFNGLHDLSESIKLLAVGHRIVHGGMYFLGPTIVTDESIRKITRLIPLAPEHQPDNLAAIHMVKNLHPHLPQVACFDTTFHRTQDTLATLFAIPKKLTAQGLIRYGFHGISYEYITSVLHQYLGGLGSQRVIVAHLGSGASMCAIHQHKSVATSMGMSTLDGLMMGSRCGRIDPGLILYLLQEKKWSIEEVSALLHKESGLLGVSGISSDMRELQSSTHQDAIDAVELFCYIAAKELAALCGI